MKQGDRFTASQTLEARGQVYCFTCAVPQQFRPQSMGTGLLLRSGGGAKQKSRPRSFANCCGSKGVIRIMKQGGSKGTGVVLHGIMCDPNHDGCGVNYGKR